jgi:hypothetical protein
VLTSYDIADTTTSEQDKMPGRAFLEFAREARRRWEKKGRLPTAAEADEMARRAFMEAFRQVREEEEAAEGAAARAPSLNRNRGAAE